MVKNKCLAVTCITCNHPDLHKQSPLGCANCGMLEWMPAFETEEECNAAYKKQYPDEFDSNGNYIDPILILRKRKINKIISK